MINKIPFLIFGVFSMSDSQYEDTNKMSDYIDSELSNDIKNDYVQTYSDYIIENMNHIQIKSKINTQFKDCVKFTDFFKYLVEILYDFRDSDLIYFFQLFSTEVRRYPHDAGKFYEVMSNDNVKDYLLNKPYDLINKSTIYIRNELLLISNKLETGTLNEVEKDMIDLMNSLYGEDAVPLFQKVLIMLKLYQQKNKRHTGLLRVVRKGVQKIIFDYYSQLSDEKRFQLVSKLNKYWPTQHDNVTIMSINITLNEKNISQILNQKYTKNTVPMPFKMLDASVLRNETNYYSSISDSSDESPTVETYSSGSYDSDNNSQSSDSNTEEETTTKPKIHESLKGSSHKPWKPTRRPRKTTKDEVYTLRQMYVEKNLDLKYNPFAYDNNLTTEAFYFETSTPKRKSNDKIKVPKRPHHSTTEGYTFKQMYVEKNLDLKYDPYAYDKLKKFERKRSKDEIMSLYPEYITTLKVYKQRRGKQAGYVSSDLQETNRESDSEQKTFESRKMKSLNLYNSRLPDEDPRDNVHDLRHYFHNGFEYATPQSIFPKSKNHLRSNDKFTIYFPMQRMPDTNSYKLSNVMKFDIGKIK